MAAVINETKRDPLVSTLNERVEELVKENHILHAALSQMMYENLKLRQQILTCENLHAQDYDHDDCDHDNGMCFGVQE